MIDDNKVQKERFQRFYMEQFKKGVEEEVLNFLTRNNKIKMEKF